MKTWKLMSAVVLGMLSSVTFAGPDAQGISPLLKSVNECDFKTTLALLDVKADPNQGRPLTAVLLNRCEVPITTIQDVVMKMLVAGVNPNYFDTNPLFGMDPYKGTPLIYALTKTQKLRQRISQEVIVEMLKRGARTEIPDSTFVTARDYGEDIASLKPLFKEETYLHPMDIALRRLKKYTTWRGAMPFTAATSFLNTKAHASSDADSLVFFGSLGYDLGALIPQAILSPVFYFKIRRFKAVSETVALLSYAYNESEVWLPAWSRIGLTKRVESYKKVSREEIAPAFKKLIDAVASHVPVTEEEVVAAMMQYGLSLKKDQSLLYGKDLIKQVIKLVESKRRA